MDKSVCVDCNADVQFLVRQVHEHKISRGNLGARDRYAEIQLLARGSRRMNPCAARGIYD